MATTMRSNRKSAVLAVALTFCAIPVLWTGAVAAQQVQFNQGFPRGFPDGPPRPGQGGPVDPAEASAYSAAISQADPGARIAAIQQFLSDYPNSNFRRSARGELMRARGDLQAAGAPGSGATAPPMKPVAPESAPIATPPAQPATTPRDSLLLKPAKNATVSVAPHSLTIQADNSELSQILRAISASTGMKVEGLSTDERVFGTYGPGEPHQVLLSLLEGSGYNVLMVGDTDGAPSQLSLSLRAAKGAESAAQGPRNAAREEEEDEPEQDVQQVQPPEQPQPIPVQGQEIQPGRSPVDIQQEMLRLRQQQQQQQPPQ